MFIVIVVIFGITMMVGNSGASAPGSFLQGCYVGSGRRVEALRVKPEVRSFWAKPTYRHAPNPQFSKVLHPKPRTPARTKEVGVPSGITTPPSPPPQHLCFICTRTLFHLFRPLMKPEARSSCIQCHPAYNCTSHLCLSHSRNPKPKPQTLDPPL